MPRILASPLVALVLLWSLALAAGYYQPAADEWVLARFHAGSDAGLAALARAITDLGGAGALLLATLVGAVALLARRRGRDAALLVAVVVGGRALVELQKLAIGRARPAHDQLDLVHSFGFPSGHSANAMITALALALLLGPGRGAIAAALAFAFVIGCTRLVLGVHWPTDVLGGWAFGGFWVLATVRR